MIAQYFQNIFTDIMLVSICFKKNHICFIYGVFLSVFFRELYFLVDHGRTKTRRGRGDDGTTRGRGQADGARTRTGAERGAPPAHRDR